MYVRMTSVLFAWMEQRMMIIASYIATSAMSQCIKHVMELMKYQLDLGMAKEV